MFILKKGHQPGVYVPLRAFFLVANKNIKIKSFESNENTQTERGSFCAILDKVDFLFVSVCLSGITSQFYSNMC